MSMPRPLTCGVRLAPHTSLRCALLLAIALPACRHIERPNEDQSLIAQQTLYSPRDASTSQGKLLLLEDGLWALLEPEFSPQLNALLLLEDAQTSHTQLFVVASTHDWGATLQRLSRGPFDADSTYTVRPISPQKLDLRTHGARLCLSKDDCKDKKHQDLTYSINSANLTLQPHHEPRTHHYTLPFHASLLDTSAPFGPYLHVRAATGLHSSHGITLDAIALIDEKCSEASLDALALPSSIKIRRAPLSSHLTHPLLVEAEAVRHGADVLLQCDHRRGDDDVRYTIATPSLARPWLPSRTLREGTAGPTLLSASPVTFSSPSTASLTLQGSAHTARGRFALAALLFEQAITHAPTYSREADAYALSLSQIIALEAPEQALHISWHASREAWRRDEVLANNLTRIAVMHTFAQVNTITKLEGELPERAQRQRESALSDWITWRTLQRMIRQKDIRTLDDFKRITPPFHESGEARDMWDVQTLLGMLLSPTLLAEPQQQAVEDTLRLRGEKLGKKDLVLSFITPDHGLTGCDGQSTSPDCLATLDIYGNNLAPALESAVALSLHAALSLPQLPPYLVEKRWRAPLAHHDETPETRTSTDRLLERVALDLATLREPAPRVASDLGQRQATQKQPLGTPLELLTAHAIHRDRPLDQSDYARFVSLLEIAYLVEKRAPERAILEEAQRSLTTANKEDALTLFAYWRARLLSEPEESSKLATWQLLDRELPPDAPASTCANLQLAMSLYHLAANDPIEARAAAQRAQRCLERSSSPALLTDEEQAPALTLEIVEAMLNLEERGSLPLDRSPTFEEALAKHTTHSSFQDHFCAPLLVPEEPALHELLPDSLESIYTSTARQHEEARTTRQPGNELRVLTAGQRKVIVRQTLREVSDAIFDEDPAKQDTPTTKREATILAQLDAARALASEAQARVLEQRIALVRAIFALEFDAPRSKDPRATKQVTLLFLTLSQPSDFKKKSLERHHLQLIELARSILNGVSSEALARALDALSAEARASAPVTSGCAKASP